MHVIIAQVLSYELPRAHSEDSDRSALQTLFHGVEQRGAGLEMG